MFRLPRAFAALLLTLVPSQSARAQPERAPAERLSGREKVARSAEHVKAMRLALKELLASLEEARAAKDVVKLNCVNENLTNLKGLLRISEQADVALQEAVARGEEPAAEHELAKVRIARQKVEELRAQGAQCLGVALEQDDTQVTMTEPALPAGDPTRTPEPETVVIRPPPASPTG